jgi:diguanylate cyclase (GGDEF)-like protein
MHSGRNKSKRALARSWRRMLWLFCAAITLLGISSLAMAQFQRSTFASTTAHFVTDVDQVLDIQLLIGRTDVPLAAVYYEFGSPSDLQAAVDELRRIDRAVSTQLDALRSHIGQEGGAQFARDAQRHWRAVMASVPLAQSMWGTGAVAEGIRQGSDPFTTAWQERMAAINTLSVIIGEVIDAHAVDAHAANRLFTMLMPALLGITLLAIAVAGWWARRISREVLAPLLHLQAGVHRMRKGDLSARVDVSPRYAELGELAEAMNGMATSLSSSQAELRLQAASDPLTTLWNRRAFAAHVDQALAAEGEGELALLYIDVDGFKDINDSLGHAAGDEVLRLIGQRLTAATRGTDFVARLGGDEFAVAVIPDASSPASTAVALAERILRALRRPIEIDGHVIRTQASIGVASSPIGQGRGDELIRDADTAMYAAKAQGKGRIALFSEETRTMLLQRLEVKRELAEAVDRDEFVLHYQPVIDVRSERLLGFEALVRWQHPERGLLTPAAFIGPAEESGQIVALGEWVLRQACADLAALRAPHPAPGELWVSVNVSPVQLETNGLARLVQQVLDSARMDAADLILEITEEALIADTDAAARTLAELHASGVRIALDDFGTGYSSLRHLQELPVDILKIDRSFTAAASADADSSPVLDALAGLGQSLGLDMVAEGIENAAQLDRVRTLGLSAGQGFLIARPMPLAEAVAFSERSLVGRPSTGDWPMLQVVQAR